MRSCTRFLIVAAVVAAVPASAVWAQGLSVDVKSLDLPDAVAKPAKKNGAAKAQTGATNAGGAKAEKGGKSGDRKSGDRQFGELEGWSPGKSPPGDKTDEAESPSDRQKTPLSLSPNGGMAIGLPF
ncbi:MAG: hypothetical protein HYS06_06410 [Methylocystis sp.]|nr:hypothetical protein [Methylocystis sp.]